MLWSDDLITICKQCGKLRIPKSRRRRRGWVEGPFNAGTCCCAPVNMECGPLSVWPRTYKIVVTNQITWEDCSSCSVLVGTFYLHQHAHDYPNADTPCDGGICWRTTETVTSCGKTGYLWSLNCEASAHEGEMTLRALSQFTNVHFVGPYPATIASNVNLLFDEDSGDPDACGGQGTVVAEPQL